MSVRAAGPPAATYKHDRSPLTEADLRAHRLIESSLASSTPTLPVLSEESAAALASDERCRWQRYWLVDPLDGTREFLGESDEFTVNIALVEHHRAVLGIVHLPARRCSYVGAVGRGAWLIDERLASTPIGARKLGTGQRLRVVGSRSHRGDTLEALLAGLGEHEFEPVGSALKFCLLACGRADFYPRLGPTCEWDTAAGQALLEAAGGAVVGLDGAPLEYNRRPELLNPHFLAFGDRSRDWGALVRSAARRGRASESP